MRALGRTRPKTFTSAVYAGEGELHNLLRQSALSTGQFCELAGITQSAFRRWDSHPLTKMPIALLEHFIWSRNMATFLAEQGWDPDKFKAQQLPPAPGGRYVRTTDQVDAMLEGVSPSLTRFLVRRASREVFVWTEALVAGHPDLEEVYAVSAGEALQKEAIPNTDDLSTGDIESMTKETLLIFARTRLQMELDPRLALPKLRQKVRDSL